MNTMKRIGHQMQVAGDVLGPSAVETVAAMVREAERAWNATAVESAAPSLTDALTEYPVRLRQAGVVEGMRRVLARLRS